MARIRSIHPGLFTDEAFVELSADAQVFLMGLWTEADDQGVFEWKPSTLRMRLRPTKDGSVDGILSELCAGNMIKMYEIDGRKLGAIRNFRKFQRPKSPNAIHPITEDIRIYVFLSPPISEIETLEPGPLPPKGEIAPQMEDVGGKRKEEKKKDAAGAAPSGQSLIGEPSDESTAYYQRVRKVFGSGSGSVGKQLLEAKDGSVPLARAAIEQASTKGDGAREYVYAIINKRAARSGEASSYVDPRL